MHQKDCSYVITTTTPNGTVYFASLAGSYIAKINPTKNDSATVIEPPTAVQAQEEYGQIHKA